MWHCEKLINSAVFLPPILFIGLATCLEDYKTRRIRNKWVLLGIIYSFSVYLAALFVSLFASAPEAVSGYLSALIAGLDKWAVNLLFCALIGYLLWRFKIWGAGDAKLLICYSSLIPPSQYSRAYFNNYLACVMLLANIFIPATLFLFLKALYYLMNKYSRSPNRHYPWRTIKDKLANLKRMELAKVLTGFLIVFLIFGILRYEFVNEFGRICSDRNLAILIFLFLFIFVSRLLKNGKALVFAALALFIYLFFSKNNYLPVLARTLPGVIVAMPVYLIFKKIIDHYVAAEPEKRVPFAFWVFLGTLISWFF